MYEYISISIAVFMSVSTPTVCPVDISKYSGYKVSRSFIQRNNILDCFRKGVFLQFWLFYGTSVLCPRMGKTALLRKEIFYLEIGQEFYAVSKFKHALVKK
jgi:hypothetical protein